MSENAYTKQEVRDLNKEKVTYQDKQIDLFDATQYQRAIERKIRYWKRQAAAMDAAKLDSNTEYQKIKFWQATMRDFINQTGLDRQSVREQVIQ